MSGKKKAKTFSAEEMAADLATIKASRERIAREEEELLPFALTKRLAKGKHPIRVWREFRGGSAKELAAAAGIAAPYLSQIEAGLRQGSMKTLDRLAKALSCDLDDLTPWNQ